MILAYSNWNLIAYYFDPPEFFPVINITDKYLDYFQIQFFSYEPVLLKGDFSPILLKFVESEISWKINEIHYPGR